MGETLFDLEQVLRSRKETLTLQEANILQTCKSKAFRQFTSGVLTGTTVAWAATWKLSRFARANISAGAAVLFGFRRFGKSLDSSIDHILTMDGSRMQKELANIMANKYGDDPWTMQHLNRRFYLEKVFDDSNSDRPIIRLRYRNSFHDNVANDQRMHDSDFHDVSHSDTDIKRADVESEKVPMNLGAKVMEDPLEIIFGFMAPVEEIHHPGPSVKPAKVLNRSHKRSHHRHRVRHQEASLDSEHLQPQQI